MYYVMCLHIIRCNAVAWIALELLGLIDLSILFDFFLQLRNIYFIPYIYIGNNTTKYTHKYIYTYLIYIYVYIYIINIHIQWEGPINYTKVSMLLHHTQRCLNNNIYIYIYIN